MMQSVWRSVRGPADSILALAGIGLLVMVQQLASVDVEGLLGEAVTNASHIPLFAMLTLLLARVLGHPRWWVLIPAAAAVAVATEAMQALTDRNASLSDVALDLAGTLPIAAALEVTRRTRRPGRRSRTAVGAWAAAVSLVLVLSAAAPLRVLLAYAERDRIFPVLLVPGAWALAPLVGGNSPMHIVEAPDDWPTYASERVIEVVWADERYPGILLQAVVPQWEQFQAVTVDVYVVDGVAMPLTVALGHAGTEGTATYLAQTAKSGPQRLRYPLEPLLATNGDAPPQIRRLVLHTDRAHAGRRLLIGRIALVPALGTTGD